MHMNWLEEDRFSAINSLLPLMPSQKTGLVLENLEGKALNESPRQVKFWQPECRGVLQDREWKKGWVGEGGHAEMLWSLFFYFIVFLSFYFFLLCFFLFLIFFYVKFNKREELLNIFTLFFLNCSLTVWSHSHSRKVVKKEKYEHWRIWNLV